MTSVRVAVCTNRVARPELLGAVLAQDPDALVATAGLDTAARRALESVVRELATGVAVLHTDGPGLARARNAALVACESDVLALVDDDVRPSEGWGEALRTAWSAAGDDLAALGGPVTLDFPGGRPALFGPALDAALGAFALADGPARDLDSSLRTLPGANLSLRTSALRGVGGFWPARGHRHARDWFAEEHTVQRELAGAGWRIRYDPGLAVAREPVVGAAELVAARLRYGARSRVLGAERGALTSARQAVVSLAGAALAVVRADRPRALERVARAAENAGALAGPVLAHHEIQPTGPTPFRASVPAPAPSPTARMLGRARRPPGPRPLPIVLAYHRIAAPATDTLGLSVSPERFREQVAVLAALEHGAIVELETLVDAPRRGSVALTFDDGYADNLEVAAPALEEAGLPATVFAITGHLDRPEAFWWDEAEELLLGDGPRPAVLELEIGGDRRAWRTATTAQRREARRHLNGWLQPMPHGAIAGALDRLRDWAGRERARPAGLDADGLRRLAARPGIEVGAHSRRHQSLGRRTTAEQAEEIAGSRDDLQALLGAPPRSFAYPFGVPGEDVSDTTRLLTRDAGYACAVLNTPGPVTAATDPFAVHRHNVPDVGRDAFADWLRARRRGA